MKYLLLAAALVCTTAAYGDDERDKAIDQLPAQVKSTPDVVSLYADYANPAQDKSIPVYLINRTGKPLTLKAQDGDVYLKLEVHGEDGQWKRAQSHAYSWCGNSYMDAPTLRPGHFMLIRGYQPQEGAKSVVRYALHQQEIVVSSNEGSALVSKKDVENASHDAMVIHDGDFDFVSKVALGKIALTNKMDHIQDLRDMAIYELASKRFEQTEQVLVVLREISRSKDEKYANQAKSHYESIISSLKSREKKSIIRH